MDEKLIDNRNKKIADFLKENYNWFIYAIVALLAFFSFYIRTLNLDKLKDITTGEWTLGPDLDPFLFLRYAKYIVDNGHLMSIDYMRYVPLGFDTSRETQLLPYMIAYFHKFINLFGYYSVEFSAVIFPAVASIFTTIIFFFLVRKLFEVKGNKISSVIALISTALLVILPSLLPRTIAGIPEKESIGFALMFLSLYLFLLAWKSRSFTRALIFGVLSGIATAILALVWGGVIFIFTIIGISALISLLLGKVDKKEISVYACWLISTMIFWIPFTSRIDLKGFLMSSTSGSATIVLVCLIVYYFAFKTKLKNSLEKITNKKFINKIPEPIISIAISLILLFILSLIYLGPSTFFHIGSDAVGKLVKPYSDRLAFTVAENKQPYFNDWSDSMGPSIKGIPLFFWMFFVGSVLLFSEMIKKLNNRNKIVLISSFVLFLLALVFSRISETATVFNGETTTSFLLYFIGYAVLAIVILYVLFKSKKEKNTQLLEEINFNYIFVFSMIFIGIIAARSAVRLIMTLTPIATIIVSYLVVELSIRAYKSKSDFDKLISYLIALLVIIAVVFTMYAYYENTKISAENFAPSAYTQQWQKAMSWVRTNTPENAVFGHWWDYGYWVQTIGQRATMLDGGNAVSYWNYLMGRHVLTAETEDEALELLYNHNVTHLLIDSTEIGKYQAFSNIGSDENYDRFSWIGTFVKDDSQTSESKDRVSYLYRGGILLDEDIVFDTNDGGNILLPNQKAYVAGLIISKDSQGNYLQPYSVVIYQNKQYQVPLKYLYVKGIRQEFLIEKTPIDGGAFIFPTIEPSALNTDGAAMYLSPRNMRALWVKMYLLNEFENFKLVHSEPSPVHQYLPQGTFEFVYYNGGVQGPIKIWEVRYKGNEKINPEYLQTKFPESIADRKNR